MEHNLYARILAADSCGTLFVGSTVRWETAKTNPLDDCMEEILLALDSSKSSPAHKSTFKLTLAVGTIRRQTKSLVGRLKNEKEENSHPIVTILSKNNIRQLRFPPSPLR
mmetsp:Transcript_37060/g.60399  ORF Transcript_37060/g.60399 Transcript_37060/m.60399 type:complete len:110 (-) Transcript_37060:21-350(-)